MVCNNRYRYAHIFQSERIPFIFTFRCAYLDCVRGTNWSIGLTIGGYRRKHQQWPWIRFGTDSRVAKIIGKDHPPVKDKNGGAMMRPLAWCFVGWGMATPARWLEGLNVLEGKAYPHHPVMLQVPQQSFKIEPGFVMDLCGLKVPHYFDCTNLCNRSNFQWLLGSKLWHMIPPLVVFDPRTGGFTFEHQGPDCFRSSNGVLKIYENIVRWLVYRPKWRPE